MMRSYATRHSRPLLNSSPATGLTSTPVCNIPDSMLLSNRGYCTGGYNYGDNVAEAVNFALSHHLVEVQPVEGEYEFVTCKSGRPGKEVSKPDGYCDAGHRANVAEIYLADTRTLGHYGPGQSKMRRGQKAKRKCFNQRKTKRLRMAGPMLRF